MTQTSRACATPSREYPALNGMRGVAAIAVMLFHGVALVGPVFPRGYLAVDLFFVLSGFVIAHAYGARLGSSLTLRSFVLIRLVRFWPLYALGLCLGIVRELLLIATHSDYALSFPLLIAATGLGLAFLPLPLSQRGDNLFPINVPSWSLFFELLVNILYAAVQPRLSTAILSISIVASGFALAFSAPVAGLGHVGVTSGTFASGCARTILSFGLGVLIYRRAPRVLSIPPSLLLILVAAGLAWPLGGRTYDIVFVFVFSPVLVMLGTAVEPTGRIGAVSNWLGLVSFPLYAIHRPLLQIVEAVANRLPVPPALLGWPAVALLLMLATYANRGDVVLRRLLNTWLNPPPPEKCGC
jgi:peptidoglycan/LPS O-acetylase OafA/YrhL